MQYGVLREVDENRQTMPLPAAHHYQICVALARDPHYFGFHVSGLYTTGCRGYTELSP